MSILLQTCARSRCPSAVFAAIYNTLEHAVLKMSKWLQRGDCLRCTHAVSLCIYSAFAHGDFPIVFGRCLPRMIKPLERCARPQRHPIFVAVQIPSVFCTFIFSRCFYVLPPRNDQIVREGYAALAANDASRRAPEERTAAELLENGSVQSPFVR